MRKLTILTALILLGLLYAAAWLAPFIAPYDPNRIFRDYPLMRPTWPALVDDQGHSSLRPSIRDYRRIERLPFYQPVEGALPIRFFLETPPYQWMGMNFRTRLFGLEDESKGIFLLGTDSLGRDVFSRTLHGARVSLAIGLLGAVLSALLGTLAGALGGYFAGPLDSILMRLADLVFALPGIFLIMGLRALFPSQISASDTHWMIILSFVLVGWASFARVIRGQVLTLKSREFVLWSRACGASHWWVLTRHILPFTLNVVFVQGIAWIPLFVLGEVTLSFLGVGVQPPDPSWGNLLAQASSLSALSRSPWMLAPGLPLLLTVLCFNLLADRIKGIEEGRRIW